MSLLINNTSSSPLLTRQSRLSVVIGRASQGVPAVIHRLQQERQQELDVEHDHEHLPDHGHEHLPDHGHEHLRDHGHEHHLGKNTVYSIPEILF